MDKRKPLFRIAKPELVVMSAAQQRVFVPEEALESRSFVLTLWSARPLGISFFAIFIQQMLLFLLESRDLRSRLIFEKRSIQMGQV